MSYFNIMFAQENAWEVLDELGHLSTIQIEDQHAAEVTSTRAFSAQLKDAHIMLDKLRELEKLLIEERLLTSKPEINEYVASSILSRVRVKINQRGQAMYYNDLTEFVNTQYAKIKESLDARRSIREKLELSNDGIEVLEKLKEELPQSREKRPKYNPLDNRLKFEYIAGVVKNVNLLNFQKSVFRLTRGNAYSSYTPIIPKPEDKTAEAKTDFFNSKSVVFLAYQSTDSRYLGDKISKLADALEVRKFTIPEDLGDLDFAIARAMQDNVEARKIYRTTDQNVKELLDYFAKSTEGDDIPLISELIVAAMKQISIYEEMNKLKLKGNLAEGRVWVPVHQEKFFFEALDVLKSKKEFSGFRSEKIVEQGHNNFEGKIAPTLFKTYGFFDSFQEIVDTYGAPRYKEANPGLFTTVTFPFLFGLMFGDVGHGLGLLCFGLSLVMFPRKFPKALADARYLLTFMGVFATYCGFIYNEFFSVALISQPSCYSLPKSGHGPMIRHGKGCVYPAGIDYNWNEASNAVTFVNSFKMKLSIVVGVLHMTLGILLKGSNAIFFSDYLLFFWEFLPQILFFMCTFGYMVFCIIIKWFHDYSSNPGEAPSIISLFINLVSKVDYPLYWDAEGQLRVQQALAVIAVICVPSMLLGKPVLGLFRKKQPEGTKSELQAGTSHEMTERDPLITHDAPQERKPSQEVSDEKHAHGHGHAVEQHDFSEDLIHQAIETIEFVLGTISNTASYLRLWALSLAHSQLAKVFLDMLLKPYMLGDGNPIMNAIFLVILFIFFLAVTFGVLMMMDLLECFLHALRLHWVEFQNKFYKGDGIKFLPHSFRNYVLTHYGDA